MEVEPTSSPDETRKRRGGPRRKTGCFTCKARHTRCDEKKPICSNCKRLGLQCRASDFIAYSAWSTGLERPSSRDQKSIALVDTASSASSSSGMFFTTSSNESPDVSSRPSNQATNCSSSTSHTAVSLPGLVDLSDEAVYLLGVYKSELATWMDLFDFENTYQREVSRRALCSELLLRCVCAFASKYLSLLPSGQVWHPVAAQYYGEALSRLIGEVGSPELYSDTLTAAVLLSSYEVLAASDVPHRSHCQGTLDLIRARGVSAASSGLDKANFVVYLRHELFTALANESPLQLNTRDWNVQHPENDATEDQMAIYVMRLAGNAIDLVYGGDPDADREATINSVDAWYHSTTLSLRGTTYGSQNEEGLKRIFFAVPAAAAAMLWYHLTCIILLAEPRGPDPLSRSLVQEHALGILSIGISDIPAAVRCFSIMPIYYAGKHVADITKKFRSWTLLSDIEAEMGYRTHTRVRALKQMVGQIPA